ncbi:MAG: TenA family protein [Bacteroidales bacterium]
MILNEFWKASEKIYESIIQHPFNVELAKGSLDEEKFRFYVSQDVIYIGEYSRALAGLAAKAPNHDLMQEYISFAKEGLEIERELHNYFMTIFSIEKARETAIATEAYANFLLTAVAFKSYEEALAALLPCFWLYNQVAVHIYQNASGENKFQKWIDTYSGAEFDKTTTRLKDITEEATKQSPKTMVDSMKYHFYRSAQYEWYFWDNAYKMSLT